MELFTQTARRHGSRPAVSDGRARITYDELDRYSDAFAGQLTARGIGPEDLIAVRLPRTAELLAVLLGILKAGAAYIPIDTRHPADRADLMIRSTGAQLLVTDAERAEDFDPPEGCGVTVWGGIIGLPDFDGSPTAFPASGDAACVYFTSGSTGRPKPILIEHRNVLAFVRNTGLPDIETDDRVSQSSSIAFDAFIFEVWCCFDAGAELVVLPSVRELLGLDLAQELRRHRITVMFFPTMAFNQVVREDAEAFNTIRVLLVGGDVLSPAACADVLSSGFQGHLVNGYGPTETTAMCFGYQVTETSLGAGHVPIGRPLSGVTAYILDGSGAPVPDGTVGELNVSGAGVARGYLGLPELTRERFLPDPFTGTGRMYATGDLVRRRADGLVDFVGRVDRQVKIRGYRVEPGEVEGLLVEHPLVRDAVVVPSGPGEDRRLVAVVVVREPIAPRELRTHLRLRLPDYMVPSEILVSERIPENHNGKRDLAAVNRLVERDTQRRDRYVEPAGDAEKYLARLWEELLLMDRIGADDDFFELGGHSLLAFRVQRGIERDLGANVLLDDVLVNSRLGDLAAVIDTLLDAATTLPTLDSPAGKERI
ncbi:non-ribosomal peptide synthetase [Streptomyces sp. NBC_01298]|uniref:non-ribosomal peptide synthetase n=1 Tax=Streptomyces sp. NBC_01298 TaxID=2903817 RepID=UPI002E11E07B|nr:non-ribosomal peptide synthetase [Streptomyces sp. NBC_01298]